MPEEKGDHPKRGAPPVARRYFTSSTLALCHGHIGVGAPSSPNGPLLPWGEGQAPCSNRADQKALKFPEMTSNSQKCPSGWASPASAPSLAAVLTWGAPQQHGVVVAWPPGTSHPTLQGIDDFRYSELEFVCLAAET